MEKTAVSKKVDKNISEFKKIFADCQDIKQKEMTLGSKQRKCYLAYIEVNLQSTTFEASALGKLIASLWGMEDDELCHMLDQNAFGISDMTSFTTIEDAADALLTGDPILFVDGYDKALKIADKGYPSMGVKESDSEKVVRGSNEGFSDSIKLNTALIRRRIRSPKLKVRELKAGVRSKTNVDLVFMEDLAYPELLNEIENRLNKYAIDGVLDSGVLEQLAEEKMVFSVSGISDNTKTGSGGNGGA